MPASGLLGGRYRIEEPPIGQGGMGLVYRAVDTAVRNRWVAVKTIRGPVEGASIDQFRKEWDALADLCHANIIDLYDVGEFSDKDGKKPYFVMPLLRGANLGDLLKNAGSRLDPERIVGIMCQACKGLQSAHNRGVIHRDLKPSNIFVLDDDSVKIIDFGIVHLASSNTGAALKGTLHYMAPEQLDGKITVQSDIFSLGVICYEALTGRKPFDGKTPPEVMDAIRKQIPPTLSDVNSSVPFALAQVVHRALAKQAYHRVSNAKELSDFLQRALRNEAIPQFDRTRIAPRLGRIRKALGEGDSQYAKELLRDLQAEGHIDHEISLLRIQIEEAARARSVHQLLDTARLRMDEEDYPLALEKVQSVLDLDPNNIDALALKREIGLKRSTAGIEKWYQIACQHRDNKLFAKAREAVNEVLKIDPADKRAGDLLSEIRRGEQEQSELRQERQKLYESALKAYGSGEISTALSKLERIIELGKRAFGNPQTDSEYERLYNRIRLERDELQASYAEARAALKAKDLKRAHEICKEVLDRRPRDPLFKALQIEVDENERQIRSAGIAELHSRIEAETDLETKFQLAKKALTLFPDEQTFAQSLRLVKEKRDLVNTIAGRAREYESQCQFAEARNQWDILRNIYPQYPDIDYELGRLGRKQQESLQERARADRLERISRALAAGHYELTGTLLDEAFSEYPDDPELTRLKEECERALEARNHSGELFFEGQTLEGVEERLAETTTVLAAPAQSGSADVFKAAVQSEQQDRPKAGHAESEQSWMWTRARGQSIEIGTPPQPVQSDPDDKLQGSQEGSSRGNRRRSREAPGIAAMFVTAVVLAAIAFTSLLLHSRRNTQAGNKETSKAGPATTPVRPTSSPGVTTPAPGPTDVPNISPESKPNAVAPTIAAPAERAGIVSVYIGSNPEPAEVKADHNGRLRCWTPCSLNLPPGEHTLVFSADNRQAVQRVITLPGAENIYAELPQASGAVQVISKPSQLKISIDGQDKGETPIKLYLTTGPHQLRVTGKGFTHDQTIEVRNQEEGLQIITIDLTAAPNAPPGT